MDFLGVTECLNQNILDLFISPHHNLRVSSRRAKIFFVAGIPMFGGALPPASRGLYIAGRYPRQGLQRRLLDPPKVAVGD